MRTAGRPASRASGSRLTLAVLKRAGRSVPDASGRSVSLVRETEVGDWPVPPDGERVACTFRMPGEPAAKQRPRFGKNGVVYTPAATKQWEEKVRAYVKAAAPHIRPNRTHAMGVRLRFVTSAGQRRDVDNLAKVVLDALNGVVWGDDSQVVELAVIKDHGIGEAYTDVLAYTL